MSFIRKLWKVKDLDKANAIEIKGRGEVYSVTFAKDGSHIIGGGRKGLIQRWQVANGHEVAKPMDAGGMVYVVRASKDGKWIVSATKDGLVTVWDGESHEKVVEINAHAAAVYTVDVSPDSARVATGSRDNTACVWKISTGQLLLGPLQPINHSDDVAGVVTVQFSPAGNQIAIVRAWHSVCIYDSYNGELLINIPIELSSRSDSPLAWLSDDQQVFVATNDGQINCLDVSTGSSLFKWRIHNDEPGDIVLSNNGRFIVHNVGGHVSFWDTSTHQRVGPIIEHSHIIPSVALSSNDSYLAICGNANKIIIRSLRHILPPLCFANASPCVSRPSLPEVHVGRLSRSSPVEVPTVLFSEGDKFDQGIEDENVNSKQPIVQQASIQIMGAISGSDRLGNGHVFINTTSETSLLKSHPTAISSNAHLPAGLWPEIMIQRRICEALYDAGSIKQAADSLRQIITTFSEEVRESQGLSDWISGFKHRCTAALENSGDNALNAGKCEEAIEQYSAALSLEPQMPNDLYIKRSKAQASMGLWEMASTDADRAIALDPLSPWGYERKLEALYGMHNYDEAFEMLNKMLSLLQDSPDPRSFGLRQHGLNPSRAVAAIRNIIAESLRDSPHILINTETGCLFDKPARARAIEVHPKLKDIILSPASSLDIATIKRIVKDYFRYSTLSHTWEGDEPLLRDVQNLSVYASALTVSPTHTKLQMFCMTARNSGFLWAWCDTCCIDKTDSAILQESLTSMYRWYHESSLTVIYLRGVVSQLEVVSGLLDTLLKSIWNTRAWTLQEYFASTVVRFYTEDWKPYLPDTNIFNHKDSPAIVHQMALATGVDARILVSLRPGSDDVRQKLRLASTRVATRQEDNAYSLFGIFDVTIPAIYGEGHRALGRLLQEVLTRSGDVTILAWTGKASDYHSCLPAEIAVYSEPVNPFVPTPIEDDDMEALVRELRETSLEFESLTRLYERIVHLPSPRLISRRLSLPGIVFPLISFEASESLAPRDPSLPRVRVYTAASPALESVTIRTVDDLSGLHDLVLIHPWYPCLLDPVHHDYARSSGSQHSSRLDQALRLFVRLKQPFGALLLAPLSRREYRRVASDEPIVVQLRGDISSQDLLDGIDVLDIL